MRIAHILASDSDPSEDNRFKDMVYAYNSVGIEQYALIKNNKELAAYLQKNKIHFKSLKLAGIFDLQSKEELDKTIKEFKPHILQAHSLESISFASHFKTQAKVVGFLDSTHKDKKKLFSQTHALLSLEKSLAQKTENKDIFYVPPLVTLFPSVSDTTPLSKKKGLTYLCTILEPYKKKDIDLVLKAVKEIKDICLLILCDKEHHGTLNNIILNHSLQDKVELLSSEHSIDELLKEVNIFIILPRSADKDKLTILSWAYKIPHLYIGTYENSLAENKTNGLITGSESPVKIRSDLISMIEDQELLDTFKENGFLHFSQTYDLKSSLLIYLKAYKDILKNE
jgi:glycosyltransferase involved in cell wall biosynthesis